MDNYVIIVAGGSGSRMQSAVPKQYIPILGRPLLYYTIREFANALPGVHIIVVAAKEYHKTIDEIFEQVEGLDKYSIAINGATRYHSVANGLRLVPHEAIVFVHDAVRCLVTSALIKRCGDAALKLGNAVPAISATDSLRLEFAGENKPLDRSLVKLVQTPQTFHSTLLKNAFAAPFRDSFTDDASVLEAEGGKINLIEGESTNIKITVPVDLVVAEEILKSRL